MFYNEKTKFPGKIESKLVITSFFHSFIHLII